MADSRDGRSLHQTIADYLVHVDAQAMLRSGVGTWTGETRLVLPHEHQQCGSIRASMLNLIDQLQDRMLCQRLLSG